MSADPSLALPRLRAIAGRVRRREVAADAEGGSAGPAGAGGSDAEGVCDLCGAETGSRHGHLVDLKERSLLCACRPCSILFDAEEAGGSRYRLVPTEVRRLEGFTLDDLDWLALRIPVDLAFFFHSTPAERVLAVYPGPMGATESLLSLRHWERMEAENPVLGRMEPDVEALLVNRTSGRRDGWLVPIDACYRLVGLFRTRWKGLSGGREVRDAVEAFFADLDRRAGA